MQNIKNKFSCFMKNIFFINALFNVFLLSNFPVNAYFSGIHNYGDPVEETKKAVTFLSAIIKSVGAIILAWGLGELILAFKDDRAEDKTRAILKIVAGVILITIDVILTQLGLWAN